MRNEYQESILETARKYVNEEIRPRAGMFDKQGFLSDDVPLQMGKLGFLGAPLSPEFGGLGMDPLYYGKLIEIIGKACCSTRTLLTVHTSLFGETLQKFGTDAQKDFYLHDIAKGKKIGCFALSEPNIGSDAVSLQTSYTNKDDVYIINGHKKWISFAAIADVFLVLASNSGKITAFLVDRAMPGIEVRPMSGLLAGKANGMAEIIFTDVEVPAGNVLGRVGAGFTFVANTALFYGRYNIAWASLAIAQEALENMARYAKQRNQFGVKIGTFQLIQGMIANAVTKVHTARAICENAGRLRMADENQAIMETNIAKYYTSQIAQEVSGDAVQIFGGNGCSESFPVERLFRESRILTIIEGTSQIQQIMIAKYGLQKYGKRRGG